MKGRAAALVFTCVLLGTGIARGDGSKAEQLYDEATKLHARGDNRAAAVSFDASFALAAHGATAYNAAICWEAAGFAARAADDYAAAITTADLDATQRAAATTRLEALDKTLGRIALAGGAHVRASVDGSDPRDVPATVRAKPGSHTIVATLADGSSRSVTVDVTAGNETPVDLAQTEASPSTQPRDEGPRSPSNPLRTVGWIAMGTGAAVVAAGFVVGAVGLGANSQFDASGHTNASLQSEALTCRTWANVLIISGAVVGITGLVIGLTSHPSSSSKSAWLRVGPGSVALGGAF